MTAEPAAFDALDAVRTERLALCDVLDTFDASQWSTASLCDGWTVAEVVAHLTTSTRTGFREMMTSMIKARFDFDRAEADRAREIAGEHEAAALVQWLRVDAGSSKHAPGSSTLDQLLDVIVHAQDISRPLGVEHLVVPARAIPALEHALASRWYGAKKRFADVRLAASDTAWTSGAGERTVEAPLADLLLLATGRPAGLDTATGDAVELVAARLGQSTA